LTSTEKRRLLEVMTTTNKTTKLDPSKLLGYTSSAKVGGKQLDGKNGPQLQAKVGGKVGRKPF
jgi:hypothetical protein